MNRWICALKLPICVLKLGVLLPIVCALGLLSRGTEAQPPADTRESPEHPETEILVILDEESGSGAESQPFVGSFWFRGQFASELSLDVGFDGEQESVFRSTQRLGLSAEADLALGLKAQVSGRLSWQTWLSAGAEDRYSLYPELRDSWLSWSGLDWLNISLGYQTWSWGASDFFGPADQLNPRDYRDGISAALETTKVPTFGLNVDFLFFAPEIRVSVVWIPFFETDRAFLFGDDFGLFGPGTSPPPSAAFSGFSALSEQISPVLVEAIQPILLGTDRPDESPEASTVGAKVSSTLNDVDLAVHYIYGWDRTPVFEVDPALETLLALMSPGAPLTADAVVLFSDIQAGNVDPLHLFSSSYQRCHVASMDVTFPVWELGIRLEATYQTSKVLYTRGFSSLSRPTVAGVLGIDYSWETALVVSVELFYRHILDFPAKTGIYLGEVDELRLATMAMLRLLDFDALEIQLGAIVGLLRRDVVLLPQMAYRFTDAHRFAVGARIFEGLSNTLAGLYDDNDELFVAYDWSF